MVDIYRPVFDKYDIELVVPQVEEHLSEEQLLELIAGVDGVIAGNDQFSERVFAEADSLKAISVWGSETDSINQEAAAQHDIKIANTPGAFSAPIGDQVWSFILTFTRRVPWIHAHMANGEWEKVTSICLEGKTIGVLGLGETGKAVLKRAYGFDMKLIGHDVKDVDPEFLSKYDVEMVDKETLLKESDILSLNCDLNSDSHHILDEADFPLMKRSAYLVNCASGPLINETALIHALEEKLLGGAALDVFEIEPLAEDSPLRSMPNVLLSPHNANSSPEHWNQAHRDTVFLLLEALGHEVDRESLPSLI
jgi:D-3-phosphoglycerate dehydrogenase